MTETKAKPKAFLTVAEVGAELDMSTSGVYKLIRRGQLMATRKSARNVRVSRPALRAYQARLEGKGASHERPKPELESVSKRKARFAKMTGRSPRAWINAWKADKITDTPENMSNTIEALSIIAASRGDKPKRASGRRRKSGDAAPAYVS